MKIKNWISRYVSFDHFCVNRNDDVLDWTELPRQYDILCIVNWSYELVKDIK